MKWIKVYIRVFSLKLLISKNHIFILITLYIICIYVYIKYIPLWYLVTNIGTVFVETVGAKVVTVVVCGMSKIDTPNKRKGIRVEILQYRNEMYFLLYFLFHEI